MLGYYRHKYKSDYERRNVVEEDKSSMEISYWDGSKKDCFLLTYIKNGELLQTWLNSQQIDYLLHTLSTMGIIRVLDFNPLCKVDYTEDS